MRGCISLRGRIDRVHFPEYPPPWLDETPPNFRIFRKMNLSVTLEVEIRGKTAEVGRLFGNRCTGTRLQASNVLIDRASAFYLSTKRTSFWRYHAISNPEMKSTYFLFQGYDNAPARLTPRGLVSLPFIST